MAAVSEPPWEELHGNLRAFMSRRVRNQADVDDLVQRVFLQMVKGLASLRDAERLHAWVYRTARNVIVDYYRSSSTRHEIASGGVEDLAAASGEGQAPSQDDERAALQELAACMTPMIRQLPPAYRQAVTLADLEGINQADAAARAGVSVSGMKSRIQRGRQQLKAVLEECCRVQLDRRGTIVGYDPRKSDACGPCGSCDRREVAIDYCSDSANSRCRTTCWSRSIYRLAHAHEAMPVR